MAEKRYFEFSEGTSNKFWEVWTSGNEVMTRYGKIGASGQTTVKNEGSPEGAQKLYEKLIREKTGKGYEEKGSARGKAPAAAAKAEKPAAAVEKAPAKVAEPAPVVVEPGWRRFEFREGTSSKFWEVMVESECQTIRFGKIGTPGQEKVKDFDSNAEAKADTKKLIAEKTGKGYVEVGGAPKKSYPRNPELEAEIEKNLDDPRGYLVYADWLQSQGDPLGELIVLQHRAATEPAHASECNKAAKALLKKNAEHFFGALAPMYQPIEVTKYASAGLRAEWQFGFMKTVKIGWGMFDFEEEAGGEREIEEDLVTLMDLPVARFIQSLELGPIPGEEQMSLQAGIDGLEAAKKPVTLRELELGNIGDWDISSTATGLFAPLAKIYPRLEKLTLQGGEIGFGKNLELPALKELAIQTGSLTTGDIKELCTMKCPNLERLFIWFGDPNYGASGGLKDIAPILAGTGLPKLKHLGLMNCSFVGDIAKALPKSKILPQLTSLDLSMGCLSDGDVDAMVAEKGAFAHLEHLNLDDNALTDASKPKVKGLAKDVNFGKTQDPDRAGEDTYRYVSVGE